MEQKTKWQKRVRWFSIGAIITFTIVMTAVLFVLFQSVASDPAQFKVWLEVRLAGPGRAGRHDGAAGVSRVIAGRNH